MHIVTEQPIPDVLDTTGLRAIPDAGDSRAAHLLADPTLDLADDQDRTEQVRRWLIERRPQTRRSDNVNVCSAVLSRIVADFEGIRLTGEGRACGCVLMLQASPVVSRVVNLPQGAEVEVRSGVPAVVVRGISATDHESVMVQGPELANRALDLLAMGGVATLALADVWSCHVAWWPASEATVVRIWSSAARTMKVQAAAVVRGPDGAVRSAGTGINPEWHASMRYLRMSEITDDLYDAFRNVYLALESLLNRLQPRTPGEREGPWLRRALTWVHETAGLETYLAAPAGDPVQAIYDELWTEVRNSIFHAKDPLRSFLPQDLARRAQVADAKDRYVQLYLDLAYREFGSRFPAGGVRLSRMPLAWQVMP